MKRIAAILLAVGAAIAVLAVGTAAGGDDDVYEVRAIFDNAGFLVEGEEVRVAGANVGVVTDVTVTGNDEPALEDGGADPGKAAVVMRIDDPAFQDFREDASCLIRPQSLIGEKFVECEPTQPHAASSEPPPPLERIPDGEPGEGQYLLPLERNGKAVDLDLVNNIMEEPYPDRFRLILNDLGAGLAARGEELAEIIERANPALRETNEVLAILARQNRVLAQLSTDSDVVLGALARAASSNLQLHQPVRCGRLRDRRAQRRPRGVVRALPELPARIAFDDGQARRLLDRRDAGLQRPRRYGSLADSVVARARAVLHRKHAAP